MNKMYIVFKVFYNDKYEADKYMEKAREFMDGYPDNFTIAYTKQCDLINVAIDGSSILSTTFNKLQEILDAKYYEVLFDRNDLISLYQNEMG